MHRRRTGILLQKISLAQRILSGRALRLAPEPRSAAPEKATAVKL